MYDLRIAEPSIERFMGLIGFRRAGKHFEARTLLLNDEFYEHQDACDSLFGSAPTTGVELTYNLS